MIDNNILRSLVLEVLKKTPQTQAHSIMTEVEILLEKRGLFPSQDECRKLSISYHDYRGKGLSKADVLTILEIIWDLIAERVITPGLNKSNLNFPHVSLTPFGKRLISESAPHYYDPDGYITFLKGLSPKLDTVIEQYVIESINCFRRQLFFASAVMLGAAAEKAVLLLLQAITKAMSDPQKKKEIEKLLEGAKLPAVYDAILETLAPLTKSGRMPYDTHQGSTEHLVSLFEMIRVQRNDAVHPVAGKVNKDKVFLSLQSLPTALGLVYRITDWLESNEI